MNNFSYRNKITLVTIFFISLFLFIHVSASTQEASTLVSLCGNGVIDQGEECDGANLAGQTCLTRGFSSGTLTCNSNCTINTSQCFYSPPPGGGGGGGGTPPAETKVIFSGRAYPGMKVTVLKDAQIAVSTVADPGADFRVTVSGLSTGFYTFSLYSEDNYKRRSSLLTFPVTITSGVTIDIDNLFIAPTVAVDKIEVKHGNDIAIFGQSAPDSEITISVSSEKEIFSRTNSDANGIYLYNFDTAQIDKGQHHTKSKAAVGGATSPFGKSVGFAVGTRDIAAVAEDLFLMGDLSKTGKVNLVDFSIAAFWYRKTLSPAMKEIECERLNCDGIINLTDFSIMAYYWTG